MAPQSGDSEILSLTSMRGIAAFWVVLFHFWSVVITVAPEAAVVTPLVGVGRFAVPLFFILSGYVLGLRYLAKLGTPTFGFIAKFWWLRLGRIYPLHAFTLAFSLFLVARKGWPTDEGHSVESFIANCFLVQAWEYSFRMSWNYPAWSISSEWFAYLIFPCVAFQLARATRRVMVFAVILSAIISAAVYAMEDHLVFAGLAVVVPTFSGGVALAALFPPQAKASLGWPWAELMLIIIAAAPFLISAGSVQSVLLLVLFFALVGVLGFNGHQSHGFWRFRPLVFLGEISYSLYMTHAITITLLTRFVPMADLTGHAIFARTGLVLGFFGVILGAAAAAYYGVEQPLRKLSRRFVGPSKIGVASRPILHAAAIQRQTAK